MSKVRVHELAKEFDIPSKDMVTKMQTMGLDVKNHMSTVETSQADWVRRKLSPNPSPGKNTSVNTPDNRPNRNNDRPMGRPPVNNSGDDRPRHDRNQERPPQHSDNNAAIDREKKVVSPGEQTDRPPQGQPGQGYGDRPQGQP
ncbi:MAG: translation initiation factor IF-2 N-terminal domain-containing protein, partial [Methylocystaceae bacterium]